MEKGLYYVLYREARNKPIKQILIRSDMSGYYTGVYLREKGYRVLICCLMKNVHLYISRKLNDGVRKMMNDIMMQEFVDLRDIEINDRENKNFREKYNNYFG